MGLFDRFVSKSKRESKRAAEARARELAGDLAGAVEIYAEAGLADEAARVLLLRADAERSAEKRMAFCALAARTAASDEVKQQARARKALLAWDVLKGRGGAFLENEVRAVARDLEEAGELERAADAFALVGDSEAEVRVLTAAGAIERLEERLKKSETETRSGRELDLALRKIADLDRTAERRAALDVAQAALATHRDERLADAARAIRATLLRGPVVELEIDGAPRRYALGAEVTIGRGDATIVIASRAVSRVHLRVARAAGVPGGATIEDLATRNGTTLAGARIDGPLPVGEGLRVELGGEIPCSITPAEGGFTIDVAGRAYLAPLGPLAIAGTGWRLGPEALGDEHFVVLSTPEGAARPYLGDFQLAARVELAHKDEIRASRGGPVRLRVPAARADLDEDTGAPPDAG